MAYLDIFFPVSGVHTNILVPPLVAFVVSFFTTMGGISGAFLLLPFQMSCLNYTSPSVSATNFIFNIIAIPSGVYRFIKEGRMTWHLTWVIIAGTLPGVFIGYYVRVLYLPDPRAFKLFVGLVLLYVGTRLLYELRGTSRRKSGAGKALEAKFAERAKAMRREQHARIANGLPAEAVAKTLSVSILRVEYEFWGERFSYSTIGMFLLAFIVGIIGGIYGVGGGAIIVPFCVAVFHLPVYTIAGAALMGTFITSVGGVLFYSVMQTPGAAPTTPDWALGSVFGIGGFAGVYLGARCQKYVPQKYIKLMLGIIIVGLAISYVVQYAAR